jgi:2-polyprenyl-3-methyl-5-hydroxy-6-metoxy-1,4-benzoquinol methylase
MSNEVSWNSVWHGMNGIEFNKETFMWRFYKLLLNGCDFRGKKVLEMGCGTGINTITMAKYGAKITFLDFSKNALNIVKRNMESAGVTGELVLGDIFDYDISNEFDIVHSEGVVEHFTGPERQLVVEKHANAAKKGGNVVLIVPHVGSLGYRIGKFLSEITGSWIHGKEYPYTKNELKARMENAGLEVDGIVGGELFYAFGWLFCPLWLRDGTILQRSIRKPAGKKNFRLNYGNWAANRWGRVIASVGVKR